MVSDVALCQFSSGVKPVIHEGIAFGPHTSCRRHFYVRIPRKAVGEGMLSLSKGTSWLVRWLSTAQRVTVQCLGTGMAWRRVSQ